MVDTEVVLILSATKEAISNRTAFQMAMVVAGSIILNLVANVIWSLMGQPGDTRLYEIFEKFKALVT